MGYSVFFIQPFEFKYSSLLLSSGNTFQDLKYVPRPQWIPKTSSSTRPYIQLTLNNTGWNCMGPLIWFFSTDPWSSNPHSKVNFTVQNPRKQRAICSYSRIFDCKGASNSPKLFKGQLYIISPHLMSWISSGTLGEMIYVKINFTIG